MTQIGAFPFIDYNAIICYSDTYTNHSLKEVIRLDRSEQAYRNAAIAVAAGTATELQKQLNSDMAKIAGPMGRDAQDAQKNAGQK